MRKAVFALFVLVAASRPASAQTAWADKLFAGDLVHDFGVVPKGAQLKYSFKLTNIYKVPLEITQVQPTCGCITFNYSPKVLQPNESGTLNINMDSTRFNGPKTVKIRLSVGPEWISTATLTVHANFRSDVVFNPGEIDFGIIHHGETPTKFIDVEYAGPLNWAVSEIFKNKSAPFELEVEDIGKRGIRGYRIKAKVRPDAPAGAFNQEVVLKTNDPTSPTLTFHVVGNIQATLSVQPELVKLTSIKVGDMTTKRLIVKGTRPFRILGVDGAGDGVSVQAPDGQATTHILEVHFNPEKTGEITKRLVIRTDLDNETVTVTVQAAGS
jgi:hypothetical protein